jgi:cell wall-associated NlpC family hydrolase
VFTGLRRRAGSRLVGPVVLLVTLGLAGGCGDQPTVAQSSPSAPLPRAAASPASTVAATLGAPATALTAPAVTVGSSVWVKVSVATLWTSRTAPRPVDAKALSAPVDIRGWLAAMSYVARRDLGRYNLVQTQALYGERLLVTWVGRYWLKVVAVAQPSHKDRRGYPGWVPRRQVTSLSPVVRSAVATVVRPTAWLRSSTGVRQVEVSIATRLPVLARTSTAVTVATPTHGSLVISPSAVVVRDRTAAAFGRTASAVVSTARRFLGLPYLWGGRSGYAVDCSGLTELVYGLHGIRIPRDADDQATAGRAVSPAAWHLADLLFYRSGGVVSHVALYLGSGRMEEAYATGTFVRITTMRSPSLARRYL